MSLLLFHRIVLGLGFLTEGRGESKKGSSQEGRKAHSDYRYTTPNNQSRPEIFIIWLLSPGGWNLNGRHKAQGTRHAG